MATFIMLTRLCHGALKPPSSLENLECEVMEHVHAECPEVEWRSSYAVLGPCDYLDIFEAPISDPLPRSQPSSATLVTLRPRSGPPPN